MLYDKEQRPAKIGFLPKYTSTAQLISAFDFAIQINPCPFVFLNS